MANRRRHRNSDRDVFDAMTIPNSKVPRLSTPQLAVDGDSIDHINCGTKTAGISHTQYLTYSTHFSNEKNRYTVACVTASYKQVGEEKIRVVESMRTVVVIDLSASCGVQQTERI